MTLPLAKEHVEELKDILAKIDSGEYKHYQPTFTCGTAHCIAGWKVVRDLTADRGEEVDPDAYNDNHILIPFCARKLNRLLDVDMARRNINYIWDYAQEALGLTWAESQCLFDSDLTLDEIKYAVHMLETGFRATRYESKDVENEETGEYRMSVPEGQWEKYEAN